jgi:starch synthase
MIRVLAVASEVFPLVKTGGLADVVGALPGALKPHQVEMRVLVPGYPAITSVLKRAEPLREYARLFGDKATLVAGTAAGLDLIVLDAPHLFDRPGNPYLAPGGGDWPDNWKRFAALARVAADIGTGKLDAFHADVVHCHDWHAGLVPALLHYAKGPAARSVMTIHNLAFQGIFPPAVFPSLGLPAAAFTVDGVEYYGSVSYMKGGLQYADAITTVSPSYAAEICTPGGGMGFDGLLRARRGVLSGILNGIDTGVWNPASDAALPASYTAAALGRRVVNRRALEEAFGLEPGDGMVFAVVSRLTWQKGMDVLGECIDGLVARGARLAVLGTGDSALEGMFHAAAARHRRRVGMLAGYDERLSHLLQGGADAILVPSRFEPCGLTQFCGLRYGCVPVVARVGGLADSIVDANDAAIAAEVATGIQFMPVERAGLDQAISRAVALHGDRAVWTRMQKRGMKTDVSWTVSARRYAALYRSLLERKAP